MCVCVCVRARACVRTSRQWRYRRDKEGLSNGRTFKKGKGCPMEQCMPSESTV